MAGEVADGQFEEPFGGNGRGRREVTRAERLRRGGGIALRAAAVVAVAGFPFWMAPRGYSHPVFASGLVALVLVIAWLVTRIIARVGGVRGAGGDGVPGGVPGVPGVPGGVPGVPGVPGGGEPGLQPERARVTGAQVWGAVLMLVAIVATAALLAWSLSVPATASADSGGAFALALAAFVALAAAVALYYLRVNPPRR